MKTYLSFFFLLALAINSFAQADTIKSKWRPDYVYFSSGVYVGFEGSNVNNQGLVSLIKNPGNRDFSEEMGSFSKEDAMFDTYGRLGFSVGAGYKLWDKEKGLFRHSRFRIGLNYQSATPVLKYYSYYDDNYVGTVSTPGTGIPPYDLYKDTSSIYVIEYDAKYISVSAAHYFCTREEKWFSFYFGYSVSLGYSVQNKILVSTSQNTWYKSENNSQVSFYSYQDTHHDDYYKAKSSAIGTLGIPLGMQFRLGKHKGFLKHTMVGAEFQPRYNIFYLQSAGFSYRQGFAAKFPVIRYNF